MDNENATNINCESFQKQEKVMKDLTAKINAAKDVHLKAQYAKELKNEIENMLANEDFSKHILICESCRLITNLRKRTAELIIKVEKLAE